MLARRAGAVIAIDDSVLASLPAGIDARVVHNGFAPGLEPRRAPPAALARLRPASLKVALVGSLAPMKGVREFIAAARILLARGLDIDFIVVGEDIRRLRGVRGWLLRCLGFDPPLRDEIERFAARHGLGERIHMLGFTADIKAIYDSIDIICFPSHLDAPGRPVFEAAFSAVPAIVALSDPKPDTIVPGETGLCIPPRDAEALAQAIASLYEDRAKLRRMGEAARALALRHFDVRRNAAEVLAVYRSVLQQQLASSPQ
jgi:glycosyltransferase involved in cell wall biosynthesis